MLTIQQHIESGDLDGAHALLSQTIERYPQDGGLENLRGVIQIQQGDAVAARHSFNAAIAHSPKLVSAYLNLARLDLEAPHPDPAQHEEALRLYARALQIDPTNTEANIETATLLLARGDYERSRTHLLALPTDVQQGGRVQLLLCADEAAAGHKQAADRLVTSVAVDPHVEEDDVFLVLPALRAAHRADLLDTLLTSVEGRHPLSSKGLRILGLAQEAEGKPEQAQRTLEHAYAADPSSVATLTDLARISVAGMQYQAALGYLAHARELAPKDASLAYEFGVVCFHMNLLGESRKAMGEALALAPDNTEYLLGMGTVSSLAQDPLQALPYLTKYRALQPRDPLGTLLIGTAYYKAKDFDSATPWLRKASDSPSIAARAHLYLGSSLRQQGQYNAALTELETSNHLDSTQPEVHAELGEVHLQLKQYPQAIVELQKALTLDPENYSANFGLLQLYARTADPRREGQAHRFEAVKDQSEQAYREAMRVIEVRPEAQLASGK